MKIAPAFSTGPLGQFASHKSVFFCFADREFGSNRPFGGDGQLYRGFESHPLRSGPLAC